MNGSETILIILSNFFILVSFYIAGTYFLPSEFLFGFYKVFAICCFIFFCFEFIKLGFYSRFRRELMIYMQQNLNNPLSEIQEIHFSHRLFPFYKVFISLLNKLVPDTQVLVHEQFSLKPYLKLSKSETLSKYKYMELFLSQLQMDIPNSQYFIFGISNNQIQLLQYLCLDNDLKDFIQKSSKYAKPFKHQNEFSFQAFSQKKSIISNQLVNDENFAQFLSRNDLNTPIYGGVFPIIFQELCIGFLWIKSESPSLEILQKHKDSFDLLPILISHKIYQQDIEINNLSPQLYDSSFLFHQKSYYLCNIARNVSNPTAIFLIKLNIFQSSQSKKIIENIFQIIENILPKHAIYIEEDNLINITFTGTEQKKTLLVAAKILDKSIKFLQIESGPPSSGEINIGISLLKDSTDSKVESFYQHNITQAKLALKESILAGPDQLRIYEAEDTNEQ
ncbi:MAG: hypothetical protein COB02_01455 [Candidatus Cloacimonadota bacterium]|nr:MAG: hypothetical protein COB02_01455 [Candidatus Cloacimonadota bacterium]